MGAPHEPEPMDLLEAAAFLRLPVDDVRRGVEHGELPSVQTPAGPRIDTGRLLRRLNPYLDRQPRRTP